MGELFDYVMQTPGNTNPAVLSSEIQKLIDSSRVTPDWNTISPLVKNSESYIKNRPFFPNILNGALKSINVDWKATDPGSMNLMASFTDSFPEDGEEELSYKKITSKTLPRKYCFVSIVTAKLPGGKEIETVTYHPASYATINKLDDKNYIIKNGSYGDYYFIFDLSTLTDSNKILFPNRGIYYKRNSLKPTDYEYYYSTIKLYQCSFTLNEIYLPETVQGKYISDSNNHFYTKTVEGALDEVWNFAAESYKRVEISETFTGDCRQLGGTRGFPKIFLGPPDDKEANIYKRWNLTDKDYPIISICTSFTSGGTFPDFYYTVSTITGRIFSVGGGANSISSWEPTERFPSSMTVASSTENSTKKFRITVDDTGAVTATEIKEA